MQYPCMTGQENAVLPPQRPRRLRRHARPAGFTALVELGSGHSGADFCIPRDLPVGRRVSIRQKFEIALHTLRFR
jgi:hypothetical protein